jgi:hypothetical protein
MEDSVVVDRGASVLIAAAAPATLAAGARAVNIKGRIECLLLAAGAFLIAAAYILVPLATALYFMIHTVFVAVSLGVAIILELALAVIVIIQRTERY